VNWKYRETKRRRAGKMRERKLRKKGDERRL
jgi:hypothetical protein